MHYSAIVAGIVSAPSGLGTMFAMMIVGQIVWKVDLRLILAAMPLLLLIRTPKKTPVRGKEEQVELAAME